MAVRAVLVQFRAVSRQSAMKLMIFIDVAFENVRQLCEMMGNNLATFGPNEMIGAGGRSIIISWKAL